MDEWDPPDNEMDGGFSSELGRSVAHDSNDFGWGLQPTLAWFPELESALRSTLHSVGTRCGGRRTVPVPGDGSSSSSSGSSCHSDTCYVSFAALGPTGAHLLVESLAALCDALAMSGGDELLYGGFRCGAIMGLLTRVLRGAATMASDVQAARETEPRLM